MSKALELSVEEWVKWQGPTFERRRRFFRDFLFRQIFARLLWKVMVEGLENIPASGPGVIMPNHTTMGDAIVVLGTVRPRFVIPMTKEENFQNPALSWIVKSWGAFPVKRGEVDRQALLTTIKLLQTDELVLITPEGTRTPALQEAKDGLTYIALKADVPIIPTAVWGLENFWTEALIPWKRSDAHIRYGRPFRLKTDGRKRVPREEMARMTHEMMYQLARLLPEHKRGYYADLSQMTTDTLEFLS